MSEQAANEQTEMKQATDEPTSSPSSALDLFAGISRDELATALALKERAQAAAAAVQLQAEQDQVQAQIDELDSNIQAKGLLLEQQSQQNQQWQLALAALRAERQSIAGGKEELA